MINDNILLYAVIINIFALISFGMDKYYAIKGKRRIPENSLHSYTAFGGTIGGLLGMLLFRHKINKMKFVTIQIMIFICWMTAFVLYNLNYI